MSSPLSYIPFLPLCNNVEDDLLTVDPSDFNVYLNDISSDKEKCKYNEITYHYEIDDDYLNLENLTSIDTSVNDQPIRESDLVDAFDNTLYNSFTDYQDGSLFPIDFTTCYEAEMASSIKSGCILEASNSSDMTEELTIMDELDDIIENEMTKHYFPDNFVNSMVYSNADYDKPSELVSPIATKSISSNVLQEIQSCSNDNNNIDNIINNYDNNEKDMKTFNPSLWKKIDEGFELGMEIIKDNLIDDKMYLKNHRNETIKNSHKSKVTKNSQDENVNESNAALQPLNNKKSIKGLNNVKFIIINNKVKLPTNNKYFKLNDDSNKSFKLKFNNNNDMYVLKIIKPLSNVNKNLNNSNINLLDKQIMKEPEKVKIDVDCNNVMNDRHRELIKEEALKTNNECEQIVDNNIKIVNNNINDINDNTDDNNSESDENNGDNNIKNNYDSYNNNDTNNNKNNDITKTNKNNNKKEIERFNLSNDRLIYFSCKRCDEKYKTRDEFKRHLEECRKNGKYHKCKICGNSFKFVQSLNRHTRTVHRGEKSHKCEICDKRFTRRLALRSHLMVHEGVKNELCSICGTTFTLKRNLRAHMLVVHNINNEPDDKQHECDICHKRFKQRKNLTEHKMVHSDMNNNNGCKKYKCSICKKFYKKSTYVRHFNRRHSGTSNNKDKSLQNQ